MYISNPQVFHVATGVTEQPSEGSYGTYSSLDKVVEMAAAGSSMPQDQRVLQFNLQHLDLGDVSVAPWRSDRSFKGEVDHTMYICCTALDGS